MSLSNLFKLRLIQLVIRHRPITRLINTSSAPFRSTHLPSLTHTSILPASPFNRLTIPQLPAYLLSNRNQARWFSDDDEGPTLEHVKTTVLDILAAFDKIAPEDVSLEAHFINDLGLDSLDIVEIAMAFEDAFDLEITDDELENIFSGQDAVDLLTRKLEIPFPEETLN